MTGRPARVAVLAAASRPGCRVVGGRQWSAAECGRSNVASDALVVDFTSKTKRVISYKVDESKFILES